MKLRARRCRPDDGWRILPAAGDPVTRDVLAVFGRKVGDVVTGTTALTELASALVASLQLADALDRDQRIAVAACIEQTIPFRVDPVTEWRYGVSLSRRYYDGDAEAALAVFVRLQQRF